MTTPESLFALVATAVILAVGARLLAIVANDIARAIWRGTLTILIVILRAIHWLVIGWWWRRWVAPQLW